MADVTPVRLVLRPASSASAADVALTPVAFKMSTFRLAETVNEEKSTWTALPPVDELAMALDCWMDAATAVALNAARSMLEMTTLWRVGPTVNGGGGGEGMNVGGGGGGGGAGEVTRLLSGGGADCNEGVGVLGEGGCWIAAPSVGSDGWGLGWAGGAGHDERGIL